MQRALFTAFVLVICVAVVHGGWQLTFQDEFNNQNKVNTTTWNVCYKFSPTIINNEMEFYSPDSFTFLDNSMVRIIAQHRPLWTYQLNYTSGVMTTSHRFSQTYGYFEIKTRLPKGVGFWPAFWLLPESASKPLEIDIFEILQQSPEIVYTTFHCDYNHSNPLNKGSFAHVAALADGSFHTYGLQWIPGTLIWYVDSVPIWNLSNSCIPNTPEYILVNLAIGGDWPKPPNAQTPFPSYMDVDYVRVYSQVGAGRGIKLPGQIGEGIPFTAPPVTPPVDSISMGVCTASPDTVDSVGQTTKVTIRWRVNFGSYQDAKLQFALYPYTLSPIGNQPIVSSTVGGINMNSGGDYIREMEVEIPGGTSDGYYKGEVGFFQSNWKLISWESVVLQIGVGKNYIVGGQPQSFIN